MKKKYLSILLAAVTITAAMSVYAAPSISTIMPEAPRVVEGNISAGQKVIVQNANTAAYKNKTVADLVDKVNDDSVQMTMEDILTALGINADEQQETPDGRDVNPSLYELLTPFVDVAIQEGDNVTYESDGSIKVTLNIEAAKGAKMKDLLLMQIDQETGKVSFIPAEELDPETGDMTVTLPSLGPVALIGKAPVVSKKATPELYSNEKVAEVADQLKDEAAGFAMTDFVKDFMETDATEIKVSDDKTINPDDYESVTELMDLAIKAGDTYNYKMNGYLNAEVNCEISKVNWQKMVAAAYPDFDAAAAETDPSLLVNLASFTLDDAVVAQADAVTGEMYYLTDVEFSFAYPEDEETEAAETEVATEAETETEVTTEAETETEAAESETETEALESSEDNKEELMTWDVQDEDKKDEKQPNLVIKGKFTGMGPLAVFMKKAQ